VSLGVSREIAEAWPDASLAEVDLFPDMREDELRAEIDKWCLNYPRRSVAALLESVAPARLARPIARVAMLDMETKGAYLIAKARQRLVVALKGWVLGKVRAVPLERGEVVAGGVSLAEVDNRTMMSRKVRGLYLCGEILDIAGPVGGYNLQAAWSTGFVAGKTAAAVPPSE
jgi:predicted flavoprotein YhiN